MRDYVAAFRLESFRRDGLTTVPEMHDYFRIVEDSHGYSILVTVQDEDAPRAWLRARAAADRLLRLIALSFSSFRMTGTKFVPAAAAEELEQQPWQPMNASITEDENGSVMVLSAAGRGVRSIEREINRWDQWDEWDERVRTALDIFYEAESTEVPDVALLLLMATLDVLIEPGTRPIALADLTRPRRRALTRCVRTVAISAGLSPDLADRVTDQLGRTKRRSAQDVALEYFTTRAPAGLGGADRAVTAADVRGWFIARNAYVHRGERAQDPSAINFLHRSVCEALRDEVGLNG